MSVIDINKQPSRRELMWFGLLLALFLMVVGGIVWWRFSGRTAAMVIWGAGALLTITYFVLPAVRRPIYLGWIYAAFPIGWTVSHLMLVLLYYGLFTPIGLIMRMLGRDPLARRFEPGASSYWVDHRPGGEPDRYFRQF